MNGVLNGKDFGRQQCIVWLQEDWCQIVDIALEPLTKGLLSQTYVTINNTVLRLPWPDL